MRFNPFSARSSRTETVPEQGVPQVETAPPKAKTGNTFPADEVVWGVAIREGFDEMDDPWYHKGMTQHAYLEGNDAVALCGFRPPRSGPRTRRRTRLGLPTNEDHPMCGMCARMVVAPAPRVPVPVQPGRPAVAVPVTPARVAISVAPAVSPSDVAPSMIAVPVVPAPGAPRPMPVAAGVAVGAPQPTPNIAAPAVQTNGAAPPPQQQASNDALLSRDVEIRAEDKN
jgi:hypothetical protein